MGRLSAEAEHQLRRAERLLAQREERRAWLRLQAQEAARLLRLQFGASRVWLFGSLDRDWFHEGSDLDLAVEGVAASQMAAAWSRLEELTGGPVDLIAIEEADERLARRIMAEGEPLT